MPTSTAPTAAATRTAASPSTLFRFTNCLALLPDGTLPGDPTTYSLHISPETGKIVDGQSAFFDSSLAFSQTIDLHGDYLLPGFIDVQINGGYGVDFSELQDGDEEGYLRRLDEFATKIVETGVTSFVPTIITQKSEAYRKVSNLLLRFMTQRRARADEENLPFWGGRK